ncbi:carboxypeptidase Taq [Tistlia consotensis]|uniref:Metal-dependent carboxypeptidase n=1 Tax=Tistlia consotensis USBA 355 TaxID=560819 RepID=A0A1Y6BD45_9PROT|nr:carboxypeptidase M32 [Tistlia consotensis]SME94590.1 carboxypeptidase Taq [Tistlia consotensis USBA 355]SNR29450.1 carboxypeptidase Taq [Tistlia consotensis]
MNETPYSRLEARFRRRQALDEAAGMLQWDWAAMMPAGGAAARAEQLAVLEVLSHEMLTAPETEELLDASEAEAPALGPWQRANLGEMRREWRHGTALDAGLVEALSRASQRCELAWRQARAESDYAAVKPLLAELLTLVRRKAEAKAAALGLSPYEALVDAYEPGLRVSDIDPLFDDLAGFLPDFLGAVLERQAARPAGELPPGPFPAEHQKRLAERLMAAIGFDFEHGRLDTSAHPFCGGVSEDVRITTRYDEADFASAMMGVLHETGHALYERGLPAAWRLQPVGRARGMAMHESQSLLMEMQACRSPEFVGFLAPLAREAFGGSGPLWEPENLLRLYHRVEPGFIRVEADEVTYPAHIILRYRLERALVADELSLDDLPGAWNEGFHRLLGMTPPDDRLGCLQDIHWYDGAFGYFPTYTLGALIAAQLFDAARRARPEIPQAIGRGDFTPLLGWLREKVHGEASRWSTAELVGRASGKPLDPGVFKAHLKARYLDS